MTCGGVEGTTVAGDFKQLLNGEHISRFADNRSVGEDTVEKSYSYTIPV